MRKLYEVKIESITNEGRSIVIKSVFETEDGTRVVQFKDFHGNILTEFEQEVEPKFEDIMSLLGEEKWNHTDIILEGDSNESNSESEGIT